MSPDASQPDLPEVPGYLVEEQLGAGSMGVVYRARDLALGRDVALKWLPGEADPEARERFQREAASAASLRHPGIVTVYGAGFAPGGLWMAMELVQGPTLAELLATERLGPEGIVPLVAELGRSLEVAHQAGILHRDVKAANVLVDSEGQPRLVDFGLSVALEGVRRTRPGEVLGTLGCVAPEVIREGSLFATAKSDVFSLGVLLYEGLTGARPFGDDSLATVKRTLAGEVQPLPETIPQHAREACLAALATDPQRRPTAAELAARLEGCALPETPPPLWFLPPLVGALLLAAFLWWLTQWR
jgi:serine/threonine protein kinase